MEMIWYATGVIAETYNQEGRKGKTFWKVILKLDDGFACIYVREAELIRIVENLEPGAMVRAGGVVSLHSSQESAARPVFLNATQLAKVVEP